MFCLDLFLFVQTHHALHHPLLYTNEVEDNKNPLYRGRNRVADENDSHPIAYSEDNAKGYVLLMSHSSVDICGILLSLDDLNNSYQFVQTPNPLT